MLHNRDYMRSDGYDGAMPIWGRILIACAAVFFCHTIFEYYAGANGRHDLVRAFSDNFGLSLDGVLKGKLWQLLTFQFLHGSLWHLIGNAIIIFFFGRTIEAHFGGRTFLKLYLTGGFIGGLFQLTFQFIFGQFVPEIPVGPNLSIPSTGIPTIGASAGALCVLAAFCRLDPESRITFLLMFVLPVSVKAKVIFWIDVAIAVLGILAPVGNVAHAAHLGGIVTAVIWVRYYVRANGWSSIPILGKISLPQVVVKRGPKRSRGASASQGKRGIRVVREENLDDIPDSEFISRKVDPILEKIREKGIHSLTDKERKILEKAQSKLSGK